ncbi:hypothetical protein ACFQ0R_12275 [Psychroflexus salinarum]|uniref:Uncharacterized protein n=1 Tax=Psychroflexus salinarum TaxID=546024 RepID=A0ABW3GY93_9FLAO
MKKDFDKEEVIQHVSSLLQEIPTSMEIVKDDSKKEQRFLYLARHMVEKAIKKEALLVSDDGRGIAIFFKMDGEGDGFWSELIQDLKLAINVTGIKKGLKALKSQKFVRQQRPNDGEFLYCWFWGILPDARGNTSDKTPYKMKDEMFRISKAMQLPIYAETRIRKVSIAYRRYGFEVLKEWEHPSGDTMYFLRYTPPKPESK